MERSPAAHAPGLKSYLTGFALALILTAVPFALVATSALPRLPMLMVIAVAAVIQVLVHLRYFLHLDLTTTPRENLVAILFAAILIS
jgi:cytochrome o ubiquinol oxidase operon protein cyoD